MGIAAQAEDFYVDAGFPNPGVAGTSCATPTASGVFTLLNDLRLQAGKSTLGFLSRRGSSPGHLFLDDSSGACASRPGLPAGRFACRAFLQQHALRTLGASWASELALSLSLS